MPEYALCFGGLLGLFSNNCQASYQDRLVPSSKLSPNRNTFSILSGFFGADEKKDNINYPGRRKQGRKIP